MYEFSVSLGPELGERIDKVVELLDFKSREELARCVIRRYVDKYHLPYVKITDRGL